MIAPVAIRRASLDAPISDDDSNEFGQIVGDDAQTRFELFRDKNMRDERSALMEVALLLSAERDLQEAYWVEEHRRGKEQFFPQDVDLRLEHLKRFPLMGRLYRGHTAVCPPVVLDWDDVYSVFFERKKKLVRKFLYSAGPNIWRYLSKPSWRFLDFWTQAASASEKRSAALP